MVVFSCLVVVLIVTFVARHWFANVRTGWERNDKAIVHDGESWLITDQRVPRQRDTKLIEALRRGKISAPIASEDGHSARPSSWGTGGSHEEDKNHGW